MFSQILPTLIERAIIVPIAEMRKLTLREAKQIAPGTQLVKSKEGIRASEGKTCFPLLLYSHL